MGEFELLDLNEIFMNHFSTILMSVLFISLGVFLFLSISHANECENKCLEHGHTEGYYQSVNKGTLCFCFNQSKFGEIYFLEDGGG